MIIIETERLILREYTVEDFPALHAIVSDPETMQHYPKPFDEERTKSWIEWNLQNYKEYGFGLWAVVLKETGEFIGDCGITIQNIDRELLPEIGYHIHKKYWRQGFGSEAARAARDWAFENTKYDCIYSYMKYTNIGSYSTAIANGMKKVKEYPDEKNGISYAYAITREEWERNESYEEKIMELISNYMKDYTYRHMLNELTQKTFGFDFESWVTQGYFEGDYIPYSFMDEGRIISNVSANRMKFMQNGAMKYYIQIGTVMTDENYRKQGLAAKLMKHVIETYEQECDGIYLFGDLGALEFYQKMNFKVANQYRYYVKDEVCNCEKTGERFKPIKDMGDDIKKNYLDMVRNSVHHSSFEQINKYGLQMFYTAGLDDVFYAEDIECFIVLEQEECAVLKSVLCNRKVALADVLKRIDLEGQKCRLGFTPHEEDRNICGFETYDGGEDYRLFYRGKELESIEQDKLYFPDLSHA